MHASVLLLIGCLFVIILISAVYFSKERINNTENKIYKYLLLVSIIGIILDLMGIYASLTIPDTHFFRFFILKTYYLYLLTMCYLLSLYIASLRKEKGTKETTEKEKKKYETTSGVITGIYFITIIANFILPFEFYRDGNLIYAYGPNTTFLYAVSGLSILSWLVYILINFKKLNTKSILPIIFFIILAIPILYIQMLNPELLLVTALITFIVIFMYFTIENPDMKMIEQLETAKDQADKANRAKTDFLSSMSHEIRTPLNAIMGFSDCINNSTTLEEAKENAKDIINASSTLLEIVNGILDISKIEAGKLEIVNSPYNARSTFEELAKLIKPKMQEKALDFSYYIAPDLPKTLYGDHANIKKVVTNLLSNAAKYTEKGFVRYEVNCINTDTVSKIIISVEDSGRGIKQENVDKLFTKFQRLDEDKNTTIEGTGLGLAITKQLTELMGGKIIVHTVYGEGSKFTVVLNQPIEKKEVKVVEETTTTTLDLKGVKILIVDDNTLNLKVATKLLQRYNADSITCSESGFNCLDRIGNGEKYDVILMDDMMPKMSGVETLRKLKENRHFKTPVVALTANAITGMKEKYLSEGFNEYLAKPIEKEDLIKVMNSILNNNASEEQAENLVESKKTEISEETTLEELNKEITSEEKVTEEEKHEKEQEEQKEEKSLFSFLKHEKDESDEKENRTSDGIIPVEDDIEEILENTQKLTPIINSEKYESEEGNIKYHETLPEETKNSVQEYEINETELSKYEEKEKFLRKKGMDIDKALELLGDMEMYEMTLKDFYDTADTKWLKIRGYKNTKDLENYSIEVHSLKSDAKYLGFMELANTAYEHELKSKEKDEIFVNNHFNDLEYEYNKVMSIIDEYNSLNQDRFTVMDLPH